MQQRALDSEILNCDRVLHIFQTSWTAIIDYFLSVIVVYVTQQLDI